MATVRKIFTYDKLEDKDIHDWLESLPQRQQSKYIRMGLRTYLNYLRDQENSTEPLKIGKRKSAIQTYKNPKEESSKEEQLKVDKNGEDDYINLDQNFLDDLGK